MRTQSQHGRPDGIAPRSGTDPRQGSEALAVDMKVTLEGGPSITATRYSAAVPAAANARIVFAHGAGAGQRHPFIVGVARRLAAAGVEVVTFNFPYVEQRRRVPDTQAVLESCLRRVIESVHDSTGAPRALFVGGKSMGGRIATHLAAQGAAVQGIFALGYPLHPPGRPQQQRAAHLPAITVPVLIIQGERDAFGTPAELAPVMDTMKAPVRLEVVPGGDHSLGVRGQPSERLYDWLATQMLGWVQTVAAG